jgi:hypothetical protein
LSTAELSIQPRLTSERFEIREQSAHSGFVTMTVAHEHERHFPCCPEGLNWSWRRLTRHAAEAAEGPMRSDKRIVFRPDSDGFWHIEDHGWNYRS